MKKKILLLLVCCAMLSMAFLTGCSNTPIHKTMVTVWEDREIAVYDVENKIDDETIVSGTLTVTTQREQSEKIVIGDMEITDFASIPVNRITSELVMENGDTQTSISILRNNLISVATYRHSNVDGKETTVSARYENNKYNFKVKNADGTESSGEVTTGKFEKAPFFDNELIYTALRTIPTKKDAFSLTFKSPSWNEQKMLSLTATTGAIGEVETKSSFGKVKSHIVAITLNQDFPGAGLPLNCFLSVEPLKINDEVSISRAIVMIKEGHVTYTLKSLSI